MDPDPGGDYLSPNLLKTTVLTIAFTASYSHQAPKTFHLFKPPAQKPPIALETQAEATPPKKKKKTIYLSFDDGPNKGTKNVTAIIKKEQVPVTMFVVGEHVFASHAQSASYDSISGCNLFEIANHSYTHAFGNRYKTFYQLPDSAVNDFRRCADSLGIRSGIIRTPGRNIWRTDSTTSTDIRSSSATADSLYREGFRTLGWDLEWRFDERQHPVQTPDEMIAEIDSAFAHGTTKLNGHLVLLAHDQVYSCPEDSSSLHNFILGLKNRDEYEFGQASGYPGISP